MVSRIENRLSTIFFVGGDFFLACAALEEPLRATPFAPLVVLDFFGFVFAMVRWIYQ